MLKRFKYFILAKLERKLSVLFFLSAILPIVFIYSTLYLSFHRTLQNREHTYLNDQLQIVIDAFDNTCQSIEEKMTTVLVNSKVNQALTSPYNPVWVQAQTDKYEIEALLNSLTSYSANGSYLITLIGKNNAYYTNGTNINLFEKYNDSLCQSIINHPSNLFFSVKKNTMNTNNYSLILGKAIKSGGNFNGVIIFNVENTYLNSLFRVSQNTEAQVILLNQNKEVVYSSYYPLNDLPISDLTLNSRDNEIYTTKIHDEKYVYTTITSDNFLYSIVVLIPKRIALGDSTMLIVQATIILVIILLQTFVFSLFVSRRISSPICNLNQAVITFAEQQQPIDNTLSSMDEIGQLTDGVSLMAHKICDYIKQIQENEYNKRKLEFKALQLQLNPHMIFNTLNTITHLAELQNIKNIREVSASFTYLLRALSQKEQDFITIGQELEYIQCFVSIKKYNMLQEIKIIYNVDQAVKDKKILKLLLQPFVENAIKHGFRDITAQGIIHIKINKEDNDICIVITDNGIGIQTSVIDAILENRVVSSNEYTSIGIQNTIQRLKLQYADNYHFTITSIQQRYTQITIVYPCNQY